MFLLTVCPAGAQTGKGLPEKADERFYYCLERLLNRYGNLPAHWPEGPDKDVVVTYLREVHLIKVEEAVFGRNFLGLGVGNSPDQAQTEYQAGRLDAWGVPYDLIRASSRGEGGKWDILQGLAINQGLGLFNPELENQAYVFLKADLHSQFGDVFKNFNGVSIRIMAREINFLGCVGSDAADYQDQIRPALTAADALRACIYTCDQDRVTLIDPQTFRNLAEAMGRTLPTPGAQRKPMGPMKPVPVTRITLTDCGHDLEDYQRGMLEQGQSWLKTRLL
jgi:hypothetical protein